MKRKKVYFITVVIGFAICMVGVIFGSRLVFQRTCERRTTPWSDLGTADDDEYRILIDACKRGKQSIKSLQQSGAQLTNIVVTDNNIKSFDRVARKYGIDYSLKKAEKEGKTEYLVFFKAKDVDVMTAAFKEYTGVSLKKEQRQSIRKKLEQAKERVAKHREITKEKTKDRGQVR